LIPFNPENHISKIMILPTVRHGCGTLSLIIREEHRLRGLETRVVITFGPKGEEVTGG
jgi:hypothetical protein